MKQQFPLATALRQCIKGYNFASFKNDLVSAFVVSLIALPLSMALAIAVGLPPQHGLYTAIVAGFIVPLLGGSITQVTGPTAAFVVILVPIVAQFGLHGIIWCEILAGIILLIMGFARLGKLINFVPYPVTTGFTAGIAVVLATLSLNDFMGLGIQKLDGEFIDKAATIFAHIPKLNPNEFLIGSVTLLALFFSGKVIRAVPTAIVAMLLGTGLSLVLVHLGATIHTIGNKFSYVATTGQILPGIPAYAPVLHWPTTVAGSLLSLPSIAELRTLLFPAFAIAILAALESLLSATVADSMAGTKHKPDAELNAIGIGNILTGLVAGIPATGAIARTATNINNGAKSPLAASMHAVFILLYVLLLAPFINYIPMASLAALLIFTAYRMSHYKQFIRMFKIAPRSDLIVLSTCFLLTVFIDMIAGVGVGMICAAFLLMKHVTDLTKVELEGYDDAAPTTRILPKGTVIYRISGPLFFGSIEKAFDRYQFAHDFIDTFIIDISAVPFVDMSGLVAIKSMLACVASEKRKAYIICDKPEMVRQIKKKMYGHDSFLYLRFFASVEEALNGQSLNGQNLDGQNLDGQNLEPQKVGATVVT